LGPRLLLSFEASDGAHGLAHGALYVLAPLVVCEQQSRRGALARSFSAVEDVR